MCPPIKITLKEDAVPYSITVPRRVPIPLMDKVEAELKRMQENGVIEKVTQPTDWCAPMVPVVKSNGRDVRICVDLKRLNASIKRERYVLPTLDDIVHKFAGATVYSQLDCRSGFWQLSLDEETAHLTTFITPFGRFYFQRLPFGISLAPPEVFQRTMENILGGMPGVVCYMDDIGIGGKDKAEHDARLNDVMTRLAQVGLKLNKEKCTIGSTQITFLGHVISAEGVGPDPEKVKAIVSMAVPNNSSNGLHV